METPDYNRENIYRPGQFSTAPDPMADFKAETGNLRFQLSIMTWISLFIIAIAYPGISLIGYEDPSELLSNLTDGMRIAILVITIVIQWMIFGVIYLGIFLERTGIAGIGVGKMRWLDWAWVVAFLPASYAVLIGLSLLMDLLGIPLRGEVAMLIPQDAAGRVVWVLVSATAGFCEEAMFRGYLMTRLRLVFKMKNWFWPVLISSIAFGACHLYQGIPNFIVITFYGLMLSLLYIRTRSLWPGIIAHFFLDFINLFIPQ